MRVLGSLLILLLFADLALAQTVNFSKNIDRVTSPEGMITDGELVQTTGWNNIRAFRWAIEVRDPDSQQYAKASANQNFKHGDYFRFRIESFSNQYFYVLVINADKSVALLVPEPKETAPYLKRGVTRLVPSDGTAFRFSPPAGTETIRLIASPVELPWKKADDYHRLKNGQEILISRGLGILKLTAFNTSANRKQPDTVARTKSINEAVEKFKSGKFAKGAQVVGVNKKEKEEFVFAAEGNGNQEMVIIHEITLKHQ